MQEKVVQARHHKKLVSQVGNCSNSEHDNGTVIVVAARQGTWFRTVTD